MKNCKHFILFPKKYDIIARLVYKVQLRHDNSSHESLGLIKKDNMIG
jgi:hypothetical protein